MTDVSIALDYLGRLLAKIRAVQGKEGEIISDPGSNAIDDGMTDALQDHPADPSPQEIGTRSGASTTASRPSSLRFSGSAAATPSLRSGRPPSSLRASAGRTPVARYLLAEPLVAEYLVEGLDKLGLTVPIAEVEERRAR